jgi:hypothetical protein
MRSNQQWSLLGYPERDFQVHEPLPQELDGWRYASHLYRHLRDPRRG